MVGDRTCKIKPTRKSNLHIIVLLHTIQSFLAENSIFDVHKYPSGDCTQDGIILVGYQPVASYTFTAEDAGTEVFFANSIGRRCEDGQNITVRVSDAPPGSQISAIEGGVGSAAANKNGAAWALVLTAGFAAKLIL